MHSNLEVIFVKQTYFLVKKKKRAILHCVFNWLVWFGLVWVLFWFGLVCLFVFVFLILKMTSQDSASQHSMAMTSEFQASDSISYSAALTVSSPD